MVRLESITKHYPDGDQGQLAVLKGINLEIESNQFIAITGASGSGKSTLLSIMGALLAPTSGRYLFENQDIATIDQNQFRNRKVGFLFQEHRLLPQYTALENILLPFHATKGEQPDVDYGRKLLRELGLEDKASRMPSNLSGGERARVALARALVRRPSLVLADEPTGQLDNRTAIQTMELIAILAPTVVMVTHSSQIAATATTKYNLENGTLVKY